MRNKIFVFTSFILGATSYIISLIGMNAEIAFAVTSISIIFVGIFLWKVIESKIAEEILFFIIFALITLIFAQNVIVNPNSIGWVLSALVAFLISYAVIFIMGLFKNITL